MSENESDRVNYTHEQLMEITTVTLNELLAQDTFLSDLPKGVILEEVNNQIALQHGKSITVFIMRADGERMPVIVPQAEGTVSDLKKSIRRYISLKLSRSKRKRQKLISWKYIWRTYCLKHNECLLTDNSARLCDLGIKNKTYIEFVKKRRKPRMKLYRFLIMAPCRKYMRRPNARYTGNWEGKEGKEIQRWSYCRNSARKLHKHVPCMIEYMQTDISLGFTNQS